MARHLQNPQSSPIDPHTLLSRQEEMLLRPSQRRSEHLLGHLQALAADERGGPDAQFRKGSGLVLLDLGYGGCGAVELEGRHESGDFAEEILDKRF